MDHLVQKEFMNIQGDGNEESIFVNKSLSDFLENLTLIQKTAKLRRE